MDIKYFCPIWGMVPDYIDKIDGHLETVFSRIKNSGYDGIEMAIPKDRGQKQLIIDLLSEYNLELIALQWASNGNNIEEYLISYENHIASAAELKPLFINCHSGKDYYTLAENCRVINKAFELEERLGTQILHEIHRGRFTFHSHVIQAYLNAYPELKLAADLSHWCNVSESYLQDQQANVNTALQQSVHIHARIGHPQACQVNDPRAPEWERALNFHLQWWDKIVETRITKGAAVLTITPEFGPCDYMPAMPYSREPVANQWDINLWMKDILMRRYQSANTI